MELKQTPDITQYVMQHRDETLLLLRKLASIGAPTFHEEQRAAFCLEWLKEQGAKNVYIDEAGNVIFLFSVLLTDPVSPSWRIWMWFFRRKDRFR